MADKLQHFPEFLLKDVKRLKQLDLEETKMQEDLFLESLHKGLFKPVKVDDRLDHGDPNNWVWCNGEGEEG